MSKEEYRPQPSKQPEQTPQEGGNVAPGIPPTVNERAKPPPDNMSDLVLNSVMRGWSRREKLRKESAIFKEITKGKIFPNTPEGAEQLMRAAEAVWPIPEASELKGPTAEELDRMAEEEMARLKTMRTMSEKIDHVILEVPGLFDRLTHLDPEFMSPISIGLKKRDARLEKKLRAIDRIGPRRGKDHPPGEQ